MPHIDGFDVMVELSKAVPATIIHDVDELDVTREHTKIREWSAPPRKRS